MLLATCLIGPYVHVYDLSLLVAAALILLRIGSGVPDPRIGSSAGPAS